MDKDIVCKIVTDNGTEYEVRDVDVMKMNPIASYVRSGERAGSSRRYGDEAGARFESSWAQRAFELEDVEYRNEARQAWEKAYRDGYKYGRAG